MKSMTEPHADRPDEPILSQPDAYSPKRVRWPGLLAVAVLAAAAIGGMLVSGRDDAKRSNGSPDRSAQTSAQSPQQAERSNSQQRDDTKVAQPTRPAQPAQP